MGRVWQYKTMTRDIALTYILTQTWLIHLFLHLILLMNSFILYAIFHTWKMLYNFDLVLDPPWEAKTMTGKFSTYICPNFDLHTIFKLISGQAIPHQWIKKR